VSTQSKNKNVELQIDKLKSFCQSILVGLGAELSIAVRVIDVLVKSELEGHPSHGLLRLPEYAELICSGQIQPSARPIVYEHTALSRTVDGQRSFGMIAADQVSDELQKMLSQQPMASVSLVNSNHIGRLADVALPLVENGYIVLGFVNYLGAGQNVPVWGGVEGRFCTNPIVFGIPSHSGDHILIDMTTSVVSEGKIRHYVRNGESIPEGWLIDKEWNPVTDPTLFYQEPRSVFLSPLGGNLAGYKGYALALATEFLSGILTGAGFVKATSGTGGNGGLFIGLRADLFSRSLDKVALEMDQLVDYCLRSKKANGFSEIRIPGQKKGKNVEKSSITLNKWVWEDIVDWGRKVGVGDVPASVTE
jgi:LDH2 family malate/lactate/ureidoglycolate dehydrogenase